MSRKSKNEPSSRDPFKHRKGSSVSREPSSEDIERREDCFTEDVDFVREMTRQGVLERDGGEKASTEDELKREDDLFRAAMAGLEGIDEVGEGPDAPLTDPRRRARARRSRRLARGEIRPAAQLDLHGLTRSAALDKVRFFLENAVYRGDEAVLIITGKGAGSPSGPVLGRVVREALSREFANLVLETCPAPPSLGGAGALVVFLRRRD